MDTNLIRNSIEKRNEYRRDSITFLIMFIFLLAINITVLKELFYSVFDTALLAVLSTISLYNFIYFLRYRKLIKKLKKDFMRGNKK